MLLTDPDLQLIIRGQPAPQGSKKAIPIYRGARRPENFTGRVNLVESSAKGVNLWRGDVMAAAVDAMRRHPDPDLFPISGPVEVSMIFTRTRPSSAPKTRETWADTQPDLSKLIRATEDALTDAGVWRNDGQIVRYRDLAKVYPGQTLPDMTVNDCSMPIPGCRIWVWQILPAPAPPDPAALFEQQALLIGE